MPLSNMLAGRTMIPRAAGRQSLGFPTMSATSAPANPGAGGGGSAAPAAAPAPAAPAPAPTPAPAPVQNQPANVIGTADPVALPHPVAPPPVPAAAAPASNVPPGLASMLGHLSPGIGAGMLDRLNKFFGHGADLHGFRDARQQWRAGGRVGPPPHRGGPPAPAPAPAPAPVPAPAPAPGNTGIVPPAPAPAAPLPASAVNQILPPQIYQLLGMGG